MNLCCNACRLHAEQSADMCHVKKATEPQTTQTDTTVANQINPMLFVSSPLD